jgi:hypothetical protein
MRMALHYRFVACECLGIGGGMVQIPPGIWPVAERDPVFALVGAKVLALDVSAFEKLKTEGKVRPLS